MGACPHVNERPLTFWVLLYHVGGARCALPVAVNKRSGFGKALLLPFKPRVYYTMINASASLLPLSALRRSTATPWFNVFSGVRSFASAYAVKTL